ncbi:MAG TPA: TonB family protein [Pyrinomonadaceae bacterium]
MSKPRHILLALIACTLSISATAQPRAQRTRVAVLDLGETEAGRRATDKLSQALSSNQDFVIIDREESRAAARGAGYTGSLNMTLREAQDLGGATGSDFYFTGDAQTLRRSSSARKIYYEAYASVFVVSTRTGRLVLWDHLSFEAAAPAEAEKVLIEELTGRAARYAQAIRAARESEHAERVLRLERAASVPVIEEAPDDEEAAKQEGIRLPQPYRRLRPAYPESAARAEAEGTVDVQLELDAKGEVSRVEVVRWAGFGLDESTVNTVRQLHFRPATRDGTPIPIRVLLRYNFRKPAK